MFDRLWWLFIRRHVLAARHKRFWASFRSTADRASIFSDYNRIYGKASVAGSTFGRFTYIAGARVVNAAVGSFCSIGPDSIVGGLGRHPTDWISTHPAFFSRLCQAGKTFSDANYFDELPRVRLGNDVWIGARAIILDGLTVGDGAIIGAGAVVTKDVEPYAIVGGIPAKLIRFRFEESIISELMRLRWWDWPEDKLMQCAARMRAPPSSEMFADCDDRGSEESESQQLKPATATVIEVSPDT